MAFESNTRAPYALYAEVSYSTTHTKISHTKNQKSNLVCHFSIWLACRTYRSAHVFMGACMTCGCWANIFFCSALPKDRNGWWLYSLIAIVAL